MKHKNKFNINYWLRKFYTSAIYQKLNPNKDKIKKQVFTSIYKSNHWVQKDNTLAKNSISVSGHGSNIDTNQFFNLKKIFTKIIDNKNINSILDMPCGDFLWFHEIFLSHVISQPVNLAPGIAVNNSLSDCERLVKVTEGVELPFFALYSYVKLLDSLQGELITLNENTHGLVHEFTSHV